MPSSLSEFINTHPNATIFHTLEWAEVLKETFGYELKYILHKDEFGEPEGYLPLYLVRSPITGDRLVSTPLNCIGGPLYPQNAFKDISQESKKLMEELGCKCVVINSSKKLPPYKGMHFTSCYIKSTLNLHDNPNVVWKMFEQRGRRGVRKAVKKGVSIRIANKPEDLYEFYDIFAQTRKRLGVPIHPIEYFTNQMRYLPQNFLLIIAEYRSIFIAGGIFFLYGDTLTYAYGGSLEKYNCLQPISYVLWEAIQYGCNRNLKKFDMGADHETQKSLIWFKEQWGTTKEPFYNYFWGEKFNNTPTSYPTMRKMWKNLPLPVTKWIGPRVIKHFA